MKFKKSLGQVFLREKKYIHRIVETVTAHDTPLVEIGPGSGTVTHYLCKKARRLICIEKDAKLAQLLRKRYESRAVTIKNCDILTFDLSTIGNELIVFGNVPYNISAELIQYILGNRQCIKKVFLTVQKEVAHKIIAAQSDPSYGYLSCLCQYYASTALLFTIPRRAFYPVPGVDSALISLELYTEPRFVVKNEEAFFAMLRQAFTLRRKRLINGLGALYDKVHILGAFRALGLEENVRAKELFLEQFVQLSNCLSGHDCSGN